MAASVNVSALKGKSAMIVGAATGIGRAIATRFAYSGAQVILADVQVDIGARLASELHDAGLSVTFVECDITDYSSIARAFKMAISTSLSGSLDIVALVAGVMGTKGSLVDQIMAARQAAGNKEVDAPPKPCHPAIDANLLGIYDATYAALYYMSLNSPQGRDFGEKRSLILVSSTAAYTDATSFPDYQVSKFGVRVLFRSLRHSSLALNIRLNALTPHSMRTSLVESALPTLKAGGVIPGKGMTFVDVERVVDAAVQIAVNQTLHGRALAIFQEPLGIVDIEDEEEGLWAGSIMKKLVDQVREAGDTLQ